ncbi:hypothetical protein LINPERHAP2_LOCUS26193 [Linum perenne]
MLSSADKTGGSSFSLNRHQPFIDCISDCGLVDAGFTGQGFTWFRGNLKERIDRAVSNACWVQAFPQTLVSHLPRIKSDHCPIFITTEPVVRSRLPRSFKFVAAWLCHNQFKEFLTNNWNEDVPLCHQLINLTPELKRWNQDVFGNIFKRKESLLQRLADIEASNATWTNSPDASREEVVRRELEETLCGAQINAHKFLLARSL